MEVIGIIQTDFATADAQRQAYQDRIELEGEGANLVGVTINLQRNVAGVIPVSRAVEFNAASDDDKIRFGLVIQRTFTDQDSQDNFLTVFEAEYEKEFG
jgi:hypothetical protein